MVGKELALGAMVALVWLNAAAAMPDRGKVAIVSNPVSCLELNASGTIVRNRCDDFLRFAWRNRTNCPDGCETEVAPSGLALVSGLNDFYVYGACRSYQRAVWLGWKYSCYAREGQK